MCRLYLLPPHIGLQHVSVNPQQTTSTWACRGLPKGNSLHSHPKQQEIACFCWWFRNPKQPPGMVQNHVNSTILTISTGELIPDFWTFDNIFELFCEQFMCLKLLESANLVYVLLRDSDITHLLIPQKRGTQWYKSSIQISWISPYFNTTRIASSIAGSCEARHLYLFWSWN